MSDNWAREYIETYKRRQQEKQDKLRRVQLAEAGAPAMFQRIKNRIQQDLKTFREAGVLQALEFKETSLRSFSVQDKTWPDTQPALVVQLERTLVRCTYVFPDKVITKPEHRDERVLRICSDLEGNPQVYKDEDVLIDESEVSEALLRPLLDFIG